jgi:hypothetical protein
MFFPEKKKNKRENEKGEGVVRDGWGGVGDDR